MFLLMAVMLPRMWHAWQMAATGKRGLIKIIKLNQANLSMKQRNESLLSNLMETKIFGEISQEIETKTNGVVKAAPIRLQVGNEHFGYIHLLKHAEQIKQKGYDIMSYINHILNNFTQIYSQQTANKPNRFVLYCNDKSKLLYNKKVCKKNIN